MGLAYQWAQENDISKLRLFLSENFGPQNIQVTPGRFETLFLNHPQGFKVLFCLDGDELAGIRCFLPVRIGTGSQIINAVFSVDTMVSQKYRKRGIAQHFLEIALEHFPLVIASGPTMAHSELYRKMGGTVVATFRKASLVRKPVMQQTIRSTARDIIAWLIWLKRKRINSSYIPLSLDSAADALITLPSRLLENESGTVSDKDLFLWRYGGSFYNDYLVSHVNCSDCQGLLVTRLCGAETKIIDVFGSPAAVDSILQAVGTILPKGEVSAVFTGKRLEKSFCSAGFLVRPFDATLVIISSDRSLQNELSGRDWLMFSGDADTDLLYPPQNLLCI